MSAGVTLLITASVGESSGVASLLKQK